MSDKDRIWPVVPVRGVCIIPEMVVHFDVERKSSVEAIKAGMLADEKIFLVTQKDAQMERPTQEELYTTGTIAKVNQVLKMPGNILRVMVTGLSRGELLSFNSDSEYFSGEVREKAFPEEDALSAEEREVMMRSLKDHFAEYAVKSQKISRENTEQVMAIENLKELIQKILLSLPVGYREMQEYLAADTVKEQFEIIEIFMAKESHILDITKAIGEKVQSKLEKNQKEYVLREQLKVIREELGDDTALSDADEFAEKLEALKAPKEVKKKIEKEIRRFRNTLGSPAEAGVSRTYIETMLSIPWDNPAEENQDLALAKKILDADHYGLDKVKERVLEFLAVRILTKKGDCPILCLVGPPGTGKTSIAKSLARALDKPYSRISLGGVRDEAEIRGHRKTYVGAMPGRIVTAVKRTGVSNPLILLDEIDKVSNDYKGDTFSALLEVLDGEQNFAFRDHYLEVPMDLSEVFFVTTANTLQTIPRPLLDRMEIIEVSSYTENEKLHIAKEHLVPKQKKRNGLKEDTLHISDHVLEKIAQNYTREAGVRQMERIIGSICRKAAREILEHDKKTVNVTLSNVEKYLGKEKFSVQKVNALDAVGIVRGLAWTQVGGDTLEIEALSMPGKGKVLLTGQMGDVMKESARIAISYIRSIGARYHLPEDYFETQDMHVHIPEGAIPKDGPSAGITMCTAILSAVTGVPVKANLAMTGEVTLRGRVLPIGGLKEKLLAAKTAGITQVIVPEDNRKDVEEIDKEITKDLELFFLSHMDDVIDKAFGEEAFQNAES